VDAEEIFVRKLALPLWTFCCCVVIFSTLTSSVALAKEPPQIDMVILAESSPSTSTVGRKWGDLLTSLGVGSLQVRTAHPGEKIGIEVRGTKETPIYRVTAKLADSDLVVQGGKFELSDRAAIVKWLGDLGENGVAGITQRKGAFGLLAKQLADARDGLAQPLGFQTKGLSAPEALDKIRGQLKNTLTVDDAAAKSLAADDLVRDELNGLSAGTALAAIARPAGAILQPKKSDDGEIEYVIVKATAGDESWPIGWPPEQHDVKVVPQLLDTLNVEIRDTPASQAIDAIQARMKLPFLYDYNSIVKQRIDLAKKVTIPPAKKAYYDVVLRQILFQAGLKYDLRVDEAGKPLMWITTLKP
jgi:hypothetical protein